MATQQMIDPANMLGLSTGESVYSGNAIPGFGLPGESIIDTLEKLQSSQPGNFWIDPKTKTLVQKSGNAPWAEDQFGPTPEGYNQNDVQIPLANGNAGALVDGKVIDTGRAYTAKEDFMTKWGVPLVGAALGGIAGAWAGAGGAAGGGGSTLAGGEGLSTIAGNAGADVLADASIWDSIGADLAAGWESSVTISSLQNAALSAGYLPEALAGLSAAELAALPEVANMIATGTSAMGTQMFPPGPGTQVGPLTPNVPGTPLPPPNPPVTPGGPGTVTPPPGNPKLPDTVFNPGTNNNGGKDWNLGSLFNGLADTGTGLALANQYEKMFQDLLKRSDPFADERSKYFPVVESAVNNAAQYNGLAFKGLNDPNFWTDQSWLKGIGDYSADATQKKLASQGYNYSGNTQEQVAKTLRDTMAQYVIPGQQNLISGANMAGNLVNVAGGLAGAQFNPAQAMGPLSNLASTGLQTQASALGNLTNGATGPSVVNQLGDWFGKQFGTSSGSGGSLTDNAWTSDYNNPNLDNWI